MLRRKRLGSQLALTTATVLFAFTVISLPCQTASALITGGKGNKPLRDPGWPKGAVAIFNHAARIAWWEGPPFGGGQWHAECRGDAKAFNSVLADFAKLASENKRVVVHDGVGHSFWLNPNRERAKKAEARMDWVFMVWQPANWDRLRQMPADVRPVDKYGTGAEPPSQIDVYTGGNLRWSEVTVPEGLEVVDQRLKAHGFTPADGTVLEGNVFDLSTKQPLAAQMQLQLVEPQKTGGYRYTSVAKATADEQGRWFLTNSPAGWHRVVVEAKGYVPRVASYGQFDGQPRWYSYECGLARAASVSGRVVDDVAQPLADVDVRLTNVAAKEGGRYESPEEFLVKTADDGRFHFGRVPVGGASIRPFKSGYCRPGLSPSITVPAKDVELTMMLAATVQVTVEFGEAGRPSKYIVQMEPEGGSAVGKWSGSGHIDDQNQILFKNVPPGRYVLHAHANPTSAGPRTKSITIELRGGQDAKLTLPVPL